MADLISSNAVFLCEKFYQTLCCDRFAFQREEWILVCDLIITQLLDIVLDILSVGGNDRTVVMIVGILHLDTLIRDARIENVINTLADQPCDMTVCQFCRVTLRLAWNGFDTKLVDLAVGLRREDNAVTKLREEGKPERIVLVHIQDTRNTNGSSDGMLFIQRCVMLEESLVFIFKQVWNVILVLFLAETALATVSGDKLASAGKAVDR